MSNNNKNSDFSYDVVNDSVSGTTLIMVYDYNNNLVCRGNMDKGKIRSFTYLGCGQESGNGDMLESLYSFQNYLIELFN